MFLGGNFTVTSIPALLSQCVSATAQGSDLTVACSATMNLSAGNGIVVWTRSATNTTTVSSVADGGDAFTSITGCSQASNGFGQWWYAKNISANATATITVTFSAPDTFRGVWAGQFSNLSTSAPLDQGPACNSASSTTTATTASFTTAHANEVILMGVNVDGLSTVFTQGSGYTLGTVVPDGDLQVQYKIVSTTQTSVTASMTYTPSLDNYASILTLTQ